MNKSSKSVAILAQVVPVPRGTHDQDSDSPLYYHFCFHMRHQTYESETELCAFMEQEMEEVMQEDPQRLVVTRHADGHCKVSFKMFA